MKVNEVKWFLRESIKLLIFILLFYIIGLYGDFISAIIGFVWGVLWLKL